jgi:hypothetical protein
MYSRRTNRTMYMISENRRLPPHPHFNTRFQRLNQGGTRPGRRPSRPSTGRGTRVGPTLTPFAVIHCTRPTPFQFPRASAPTISPKEQKDRFSHRARRDPRPSCVYPSTAKPKGQRMRDHFPPERKPHSQNHTFLHRTDCDQTRFDGEDTRRCVSWGSAVLL